MTYEIIEKYHRQRLHIDHELGLICPICKTCHVQSFITCKDITAKDLEDIILGVKKRFYYTHVLNCNWG